jgi:hypothetical protein
MRFKIPIRVTFDLRQQKLARAAALKLILPAEG